MIRLAPLAAWWLAVLGAGCSLDLGRLRSTGADAGPWDGSSVDAGDTDATPQDGGVELDAGDRDAAAQDGGVELDAGVVPDASVADAAQDGGTCAAACTPDGRFGTASQVALSGTAQEVEIGDVTGDGFLEVVVLESGLLEVFTLLPSGPCRGRSLTSLGSIATSASASSIALGDLDGDGDADAAVVGTSGQLLVHLGGSAGLSAPLSATFTGNAFGVALLGSRIDVAIGGAAGAIRSFRLDGVDLVDLGETSGPPLVEIASLRLADGSLALASLVLSPATVNVDRIDAGGSLVRFATVSLPAAGSALGVGDLDGDGDDDIVTNGLVMTRLSILLGSASGFGIAPRADADDIVSALAVHRLDEDLQADLAVVAGAFVFPYLLADPTVPGGALVARPGVALPGDGVDVDVGDVDGDGLPDLAVVGHDGASDEVRWVPGVCP